MQWIIYLFMLIGFIASIFFVWYEMLGGKFKLKRRRGRYALRNTNLPWTPRRRPRRATTPRRSGKIQISDYNPAKPTLGSNRRSSSRRRQSNSKVKVITEARKYYCVSDGGEIQPAEINIRQAYSCKCGWTIHTRCLSWLRKQYNEGKAQRDYRTCPSCRRRLPKTPPYNLIKARTARPVWS